ncbi:PREDICTED: pentatricopeptide repeat-containing protein At4g01990, mitochondrial-like [Ipomoea nil]|uniref:pentatricopeptide repeat-containing protein At4g01990, mitochondrial-like n=1 Tax=Ipomoea nil TaxID=35883 RepID=UPI000901A4B1|nr:PREDICTED: pentatricopeptide repeat-containing protein At4g01990, mitochondrial-like [Ipomoea nil]
MGQVASRSSSAYLLRTTAARRWLSAEAKALPAESAAATISTPNEEGTVGGHGIANITTAAKNKGNIVEALDKAVNNGIPIKKWRIITPINQFRRDKNYQAALQLSEWMESKTSLINNADRAVRIELLAKSKNLDSAEEYFNGLQDSEKTTRTYGALLNCYCAKKHLEKASELFEKMKEVNAISTLNYNNMISLYLQTGQPEKVVALVQEMEENKIDRDSYTCNQLINSYGMLKDIDAAEGVLEKMKADNIKTDSFTYGNLATILFKAGLLDKAQSVLEKMEEMKNGREELRTLITLYGQISNPSGVYRVWESLKSAFPKPSNKSYLIMLLALSKLGDFENLEKYFREWESENKLYDMRISNVLLDSYLRRDMIGEAELLYNSVLKRGAQPGLRTLELLTSFYVKNSQFDLALKYLEMGASQAAKSKKKWVLPNETVEGFLKYFEENREADATEKYYESLKRVSCPDSTLYDCMLSFNIVDQKAQA